MPAGPALHLDLERSRLLAGALILVHGLALAAAWISLSGWPLYLAGFAVLASLAGALAQAQLRAAHQAVSLELHEDGRASWRNRDGSRHEGRLGASQFVSAALAILELEPAGRGRRKRIVVAADSLSAQDFRRLRTWLRWRVPQSRPGNLTED